MRIWRLRVENTDSMISRMRALVISVEGRLPSWCFWLLHRPSRVPEARTARDSAPSDSDRTRHLVDDGSMSLEAVDRVDEMGY